MAIASDLGVQIPLTPEQLAEHSVRDHVMNGWVAMIVAVCNLVPLFLSDFQGLTKVWQFPFLGISIYFFLHTEPDVKLKYGSWLRAWSDMPTYQHRLMTTGAIAGACTEIALALFHVDVFLTRVLMPAGLVGAGIIFYAHHHGDEPTVLREHNIMAFLFVLTGITWVFAREVSALAPLRFAWPILFGIEAYLFISYQEPVSVPPVNGHDH